MKRYSSTKFGASLLCLLAAFSLLGGYLRAQDEGEPGTGFNGGEMVRGVVTAASGDRLSLKTDAGQAYQVTVTPNTKMMKDRQPVRLADVKVGDSIGAMGVLDAPTHTVHAMFVMVVDPEQARKMREGLGKLYITGKITAMEDLKLTILRPDGVSQVIAVDEGTSFRRGGRGLQSMITGIGPVPGGAGPDGQPRRSGPGNPPSGPSGESITLADIKVGDAVVGRGEVKSGTFIPTELAVADPNARQHRRGGPAASAAAPPQ